MGCWNQIISNAISYERNPEIYESKLKTLTVDDRQIVRYSKANSSVPSNKVFKKLNFAFRTKKSSKPTIDLPNEQSLDSIHVIPEVQSIKCTKESVKQDMWEVCTPQYEFCFPNKKHNE